MGRVAKVRKIMMSTKSHKKRAPNLDDETISNIVEILDGWSLPKLTWEIFIEHIFLRLRVRYTRQTLNNYSRIKDSFSVCKKKLTGVNPDDFKKETPNQQRICRLEAEVDRLTRENNSLLEQFNRWVYNGYLKTMDEKMREFMNEPLPSVHREVSEDISNIKTGIKRK